MNFKESILNIPLASALTFLFGIFAASPMALGTEAKCEPSILAQESFDEKYGPLVDVKTVENLEEIRDQVCGEAAKLVTKAYGGLVFSKFDCLDGSFSLRRIGTEDRLTAIIGGVKFYYGRGRTIRNVIATLVPMKTRNGPAVQVLNVALDFGPGNNPGE